ncbi:MAG: hypothetical protein ACR2IP_10520 [Solirubrobacteraceae bacterium]
MATLAEQSAEWLEINDKTMQVCDESDESDVCLDALVCAPLPAPSRSAAFCRSATLP